MSATHIQVVKWSFPAFALIIGLLWYKRRRVDRTDPGGISNPDCSNESPANYNKEAVTTKSCLNLYDSSVKIDESFSQNSSSQLTEEIVCSPRKRSESLDIPQRKNGSQATSTRSRTPEDVQAWYLDTPSHKMDIQLGSNPKISNFDMVAKSRSASSLDSTADSSGKVLKIFENVTEEEELQEAISKNNSSEIVDKIDENDTSNENDYIPSKESPVTTPTKDSVKTQSQALSERDSANHSPVSGVLEGSVTDEARSEGSTDSGKGKIQ